MELVFDIYSTNSSFRQYSRKGEVITLVVIDQ